MPFFQPRVKGTQPMAPSGLPRCSWGHDICIRAQKFTYSHSLWGRRGHKGTLSSLDNFEVALDILNAGQVSYGQTMGTHHETLLLEPLEIAPCQGEQGCERSPGFEPELFHSVGGTLSRASGAEPVSSSASTQIGLTACSTQA